jgi:hypothetical protein
MPNKWVEHVRKFAKDNNLSYGCALSDPNIRKGYEPTGKKAQAKRADEERDKRQDEEEKRLSDIKKNEEREKLLALVKADSRTHAPTKITAKQMRHRAFLEKYKDNSELLRKDLTEAFNKKAALEKAALDKKKTPAKKTPAKKTPAKKPPTPAKKPPTPARKTPTSVGLTEAENRRLKQLKEQLANMDRMGRMGIMMDEDQREEIEGRIRDLERKK